MMEKNEKYIGYPGQLTVIILKKGLRAEVN